MSLVATPYTWGSNAQSVPTLAYKNPEVSLPDGIYRTILDSIGDGVYVVDRDRTILYWNKAAERISGYDAAEVVGRRCSDGILKHCDSEGSVLCTEACPLKQTMVDGWTREVEVYLHHKEGHRVPVHVRSAVLRDGFGRVNGCVELFADNSSKLAVVEEAKELNRVAFIDVLTQVGNRRFVHSRLSALLADPTGMEMPVGVLFVDVDHFKAFNDRHGHETGDRVLREVAATLSGNLRSYDFVGRWGGEEFIVVTAKATLHDLDHLANRLRELVAQTDISVGGETLRVNVSIGGTLAIPTEGIDAVVARADGLLYESKKNGRNRATVR